MCEVFDQHCGSGFAGQHGTLAVARSNRAGPFLSVRYRRGGPDSGPRLSLPKTSNRSVNWADDTSPWLRIVPLLDARKIVPRQGCNFTNVYCKVEGCSGEELRDILGESPWRITAYRTPHQPPQEGT